MLFKFWNIIVVIRNNNIHVNNDNNNNFNNDDYVTITMMTTMKMIEDNNYGRKEMSLRKYICVPHYFSTNTVSVLTSWSSLSALSLHYDYWHIVYSVKWKRNIIFSDSFSLMIAI